MISNFVEIVKLNKQKRFDLIVNYSMSNGLIGLLVAKIFNIPFIFHYIDILHHLVPLKSVRFLARCVTRVILKYADCVLVYTKFHKNLVLSEGCANNKIKILPNGVSLANTRIDLIKYEQLRKHFSIKNDDFVIFFMGYLYEFAGLKEIIEYYNDDVNQGHINLKFIIVGDGGIYHELKRYIEEINANWVYLTGRVPYFEISEYIALSVLCLLSFDINDITKEITPIKIIEYMAMKKPVLSNNLPGVISEIGKDNGVIFAKSQAQLIKSIRDFYGKKEVLKIIEQKGYELVKENYALEKILLSFKKIILELIISAKRS